MNLNRKIRKMFAYVCAVVMVITGMAGYQARVSGAMPDDMTVIDNTKDLHKPAGTEWQLYFGGSGGTVALGAFKGGTSLTDAFTLYVEQTSGSEWGIQAVTPQVSGMVPTVQYQYSLKFTASKAGVFYTKENVSNSKKTMQEYSEGENVVTGLFTATTTRAVILIDMMDVESDTLFEFTEISITDDFEEITTEAPTTDAEGYHYTISEEWRDTEPWQAFAGGKNSMKYKAGTMNASNLGLDIEILNNSGADWSLQARILKDKKAFGPLVKGDTYNVEFTYTSNMEGSIVFQIAGNNNDPMQIEAGTHTISFKYTSLETDYPNIYMNLAGLPTGTKFNFNAEFKEDISETDTPEVTTPSESDTPEVTTPSESDMPEITTPSEVETPEVTTPIDVQETTLVVEKTTVAPEIRVTAPGKTKITKVAAKKKFAKKVKLSFKKVRGAKGYQVAVYKTKKNAKQNKKAVVKKLVKKVKITVSSKKLKGKKQLFVRVRAYVLDKSDKKIYGKWSNIKTVTVK